MPEFGNENVDRVDFVALLPTCLNLRLPSSNVPPLANGLQVAKLFVGLSGTM